MNIDRHPLLTAGAGPAEQNLTDDAIVPYCDDLHQRLCWLDKVLEAEYKEGHLSRAAQKTTATFLQELCVTIAVLALKHGRQLLEVEPLPLTIDPTESGMPTFKDFWLLQEDRERAQQRLTHIPERAEVIDQAIEAIYGGHRPLKQQMLWLERSYLEQLANTPVVTDFRQMPTLRLSKKRGDQLFVTSWTGIIRSRNLFECTTLHFTERSGWHITGGQKDLMKLIDSIANGRHQLHETVGLLNQAPWIVPRTLERITIGPYHHQWTQNDDFIKHIFDASHSPSPFMLRATIERIATTGAAKRMPMDRLFGREPMEVGPNVCHRVLLVPLAMKQYLGDTDEEGQPCTVYGVSQEGDLVC
ncbi:MAG: hypothetical protein GFH27_549357n14 [Chloroflexi bacterium AL-W]|nr:hypothetical protein [Chloroflexi bacterium AL-N1]NOK70651.1 hypothetical protein [Chloroflexi bacterium AL-N10]NOK78470.1 hypothetical protein [Chloroflexi bacterium AL-N5]NOK85554.1 hypothetical protein [Chloroflexi bacterium AL-W]NOK92468.1 hypothetical protein [Chloroflexi bacterium AL-N15]